MCSGQRRAGYAARENALAFIAKRLFVSYDARGIEGGTRRWLFAVLHTAPVNSRMDGAIGDYR